MHTPARMTSQTGLMFSSSAAGTANMAMPTPNQPICVKLMSTEGKYEPYRPNERCASRSSERPVSLPM